MPNTELIIVGVVAFIVGIAFVKLLDWYTKRGAALEAKRILEGAEQQAGTKVREAEIEIKERALQQKADVEKLLHSLRPLSSSTPPIPASSTAAVDSG